MMTHSLKYGIFATHICSSPGALQVGAVHAEGHDLPFFRRRRQHVVNTFHGLRRRLGARARRAGIPERWRPRPCARSASSSGRRLWWKGAARRSCPPGRPSISWKGSPSPFARSLSESMTRWTLRPTSTSATIFEVVRPRARRRLSLTHPQQWSRPPAASPRGSPTPSPGPGLCTTRS